MNDEPNIDPAEAEARLDDLEEKIQQTRREAEDHGTLGPAADDDEMNTQGVAPPA